MKGKQLTRTKEACTESLKPIEDTLYVIGGKWKLRIIIALMDSGKRFNELQRSVSGISATVLSNELKELELNGFIERRILADSITTIYELTPYSHTLHDVIQSMNDWGKMH